MFRTFFTALKYLLLGVSLGLLVAPRSGEETRRLLQEKGSSWLQGTPESQGRTWGPR